LIHSWIANLVSLQVAQSIVFIENVLDVWTGFKERFPKSDRTCVAKLQSNINNLKQSLYHPLNYLTKKSQKKGFSSPYAIFGFS